MTRDESMYPDPERFFPERHLNDNGEITSLEDHILFGFGRRCVDTISSLVYSLSLPTSFRATVLVQESTLLVTWWVHPSTCYRRPLIDVLLRLALARVRPDFGHFRLAAQEG